MSRNREFAEELADILRRIADLKLEESAFLEKAKDSGVNVKALRRVAREMIMDQRQARAAF